MERPANWKVVTLGAVLTGLGAAGVGVLQTESGSPGSGPVSPAPLFNDERLLASGSGGGLCWDGYVFSACVQGPGWVDWNPGWGHWGHWGHGHGHGF
ncbi:MAG: hypothetical protein ACM4D3_21865 [Candidatus Sericytochromatia bacterium]